MMTRAGTDAADNPVQNPTPVRPLKPQRTLFVVLCIAMAVWIAALIGMYVKWVWRA